MEPVVILTVALLLSAALNDYYFTASQDLHAGHFNGMPMGERGSLSSTANGHDLGGPNTSNNLLIAYLTGFSGLGAFAAILAVYRWTGRIDKMRLLGNSVTILALTTGIIHLLLMNEHLQTSLISGAFFGISGSTLIAYGIMASKLYNQKIRMAYCFVGIGGAAALIVLYSFTRLVAFPYLGGGIIIESVSTLDIITKAVEVLLILVLVYSAVRLKENRQLEVKKSYGRTKESATK